MSSTGLASVVIQPQCTLALHGYPNGGLPSASSLLHLLAHFRSSHRSLEVPDGMSAGDSLE